jgi:SAM-dependent methyltransferase/DNA-binding HxlR family transcriptional regulator
MLDIVDSASQAFYSQLEFPYRPRYTPLMRTLASGPATVTDLVTQLALTQGAVSQTLKLMADDGLITRSVSPGDGRQVIITLSEHGQGVLDILRPHWARMIAASAELEMDAHVPIRATLRSALAVCDERAFAERLHATADANPATTSVKSRGGHFEAGGDAYAAFRPQYPPALAAELAALTERQSLALDVGCGTGQLTTLLAAHFDQVVGTDASADQLAHAVPAANVHYRHEGAESIAALDNSVDLITVAQAAHWFDLPHFYQQVRRVAAPGAVIALISYGVPFIEHACNALFQQAYWRDLYDYWPAERRHVERAYADLPFPFEPVSLPSLEIAQSLDCDGMIAYMRTWSAYGVACKRGDQANFDRVFAQLRQAWPAGGECRVVWPLAVKVGRVHAP